MSDCRRCWVLLVREPKGRWRPAATSPFGMPVVRQAAAAAWHDEREPVPAAVHAGPEVPFMLRSPPREQRVCASGAVIEPGKAQDIVHQVLDDVLGRDVPPPGARGALFFAIDQLRVDAGMHEQVRRAERVSVGIHQLECALQHGDRDQATLARGQLRALAGEWGAAVA